MPSETHYFTGKAFWAKVYSPDEKYNRWKVNLGMTEAELERAAWIGLQLQPKDIEGHTCLTFTRPVSKLIKNELVKFDPPKVLDDGGNPMNALIGNGSDVTLKVITYDTIKGKGHRLESVRVDKLVEYKKPDNPEGKPKATESAGLTGVPF